MLRKLRLSEIYYTLVVLGYTATLCVSFMRPGVFAAALMVLVGAELLLRRELRIKSLPDIMAVLFFAYQLLSVVWLLAGGYPLSVYLSELTASVLPMIFYFVGKSAGEDTKKWMKWYLIAMLILGILGVILYAWAPQFYNDWSYDWSYNSKADVATTRVRMNSVVGSTCLSFNMVAGMLAGALFLTGNSKEEQGQNHPRRDLIFGIACIALCLLFAILANQRSGLVAAGLVILYLNVLLVFVLKLVPKKAFYIEIGVAAILIVALAVISPDALLKYWYRIISLPGAVAERSEQWVAAVNNMTSFWFGNGLGANGHHALGVEGAHVIADGGLIKLYCENGIFGFSMWLYLLILSAKRGLAKIGTHYVSLGIVAVGLLQSIGSNIRAFQLCAPIFWFAVGSMCAGSESEDEASQRPDA